MNPVQEPRNSVLAAALLGSAAAATAGAVWSARAIARKNGEGPLNSVMQTAATACELAHGDAADGACET